MSDLVECHSDFEYAERPTALHWEGQRLTIEKTLETCRTPDGKRFRVQTIDGQLFELYYSDLYDEWRITKL
jgi:hypothetical protein